MSPWAYGSMARRRKGLRICSISISPLEVYRSRFAKGASATFQRPPLTLKAEMGCPRNTRKCTKRSLWKYSNTHSLDGMFSTDLIPFSCLSRLSWTYSRFRLTGFPFSFPGFQFKSLLLFPAVAMVLARLPSKGFPRRHNPVDLQLIYCGRNHKFLLRIFRESPRRPRQNRHLTL